MLLKGLIITVKGIFSESSVGRHLMENIVGSAELDLISFFILNASEYKISILKSTRYTSGRRHKLRQPCDKGFFFFSKGMGLISDKLFHIEFMLRKLFACKKLFKLIVRKR